MRVKGWSVSSMFRPSIENQGRLKKNVFNEVLPKID